MGGNHTGSQRFVAEAGLTMSIVCAGISVFPFLAALVMWVSAATGAGPHRALLLALGLVGVAAFSFAVSAVFRVRIGEPVFKRRTR
jgi:hypothetical protein